MCDLQSCDCFIHRGNAVWCVSMVMMHQFIDTVMQLKNNNKKESLLPSSGYMAPLQTFNFFVKSFQFQVYVCFAVSSIQMEYLFVQ